MGRFFLPSAAPSSGLGGGDDTFGIEGPSSSAPRASSRRGRFFIESSATAPAPSRSLSSRLSGLSVPSNLPELANAPGATDAEMIEGGNRFAGLLGGIEEAPAVTAAYLSPGGEQVLSEGLTPQVPSIEEQAETGGLTRDQIAGETSGAFLGPGHVGAIASKVGSKIAGLAASPMNAGILLATGGASGLAGGLGERLGVASIEDLGSVAARGQAARLAGLEAEAAYLSPAARAAAASAARLGRAAEIGQAGLSGYFAASMAPGAVHGIRSTAEKIGARLDLEGKPLITPEIAGEAAGAGLDTLFTIGAAKHALGGVAHSAASKAYEGHLGEYQDRAMTEAARRDVEGAQRSALEEGRAAADRQRQQQAFKQAAAASQQAFEQGQAQQQFEAAGQQAYNQDAQQAFEQQQREFLRPDPEAEANRQMAQSVREQRQALPGAIEEALAQPPGPPRLAGTPAPIADDPYVTYSDAARAAAAPRGIEAQLADARGGAPEGIPPELMALMEGEQAAARPERLGPPRPEVPLNIEEAYGDTRARIGESLPIGDTEQPIGPTRSIEDRMRQVREMERRTPDLRQIAEAAPLPPPPVAEEVHGPVAPEVSLEPEEVHGPVSLAAPEPEPPTQGPQIQAEPPYVQGVTPERRGVVPPEVAREAEARSAALSDTLEEQAQQANEARAAGEHQRAQELGATANRAVEEFEATYPHADTADLRRKLQQFGQEPATEHQVTREQERAERLKKREKLLRREDKTASMKTLRRLAAAEESAEHDALTGLPSRHSWEQERINTKKYRGHASMDVSGLKEINDKHGHSAGDGFILAISQGMEKIAKRMGARLSRVGGDEFTILGRDEQHAANVAATIKGELLDSRVKYSFIDENGEKQTLTYESPVVDYGYGDKYQVADKHLKDYRDRAEARGERVPYDRRKGSAERRERESRDAAGRGQGGVRGVDSESAARRDLQHRVGSEAEAQALRERRKEVRQQTWGSLKGAIAALEAKTFGPRINKFFDPKTGEVDAQARGASPAKVHYGLGEYVTGADGKPVAEFPESGPEIAAALDAYRRGKTVGGKHQGPGLSPQQAELARRALEAMDARNEQMLDAQEAQRERDAVSFDPDALEAEAATGADDKYAIKKRGGAAQPEAARTAGTGQRTYFNGAEGEYTGRTQTIGGVTLHEIELLEGPNKGKMRFVRDSPERTAELQAARDRRIAEDYPERPAKTKAPKAEQRSLFGEPEPEPVAVPAPEGKEFAAGKPADFEYTDTGEQQGTLLKMGKGTAGKLEGGLFPELERETESARAGRVEREQAENRAALDKESKGQGQVRFAAVPSALRAPLDTLFAKMRELRGEGVPESGGTKRTSSQKGGVTMGQTRVEGDQRVSTVNAAEFLKESAEKADAMRLTGERRQRFIAQDAAKRIVDAAIHEAAHGPDPGHGPRFHARVDDMTKALGPARNRAISELTQRIMNPEPKGVTLEQIRGHLGKRFQVKDEGKGIYSILAPRGERVLVRQDGSGIEVNMEALREAHPDALDAAGNLRPDVGIAGRWQKIPEGGLIWLAKDGDVKTFRHEWFHAAMDMALTPGERRAVMKQYGGKGLSEAEIEERAAEAYAEWKPGEAHGMFGKIHAFFKRLYRGFRPDAESAFEAVHSGRAFERGPGAAEGGAPKYATAAHPTAKPRFNIPEETRGDAFIRNMQDRFIRAKRVIDAVVAQGGKVDERTDFRAAEELYHGAVNEKITDARKRYELPLAKAMAKAREELPVLDQFLRARHAGARNAAIEARHEGRVKDGSGMSTQEAAKILADYNRRGLTKKLEPAVKLVDAMREEQRKVLLDSGLISKEQLQGWEDSMGPHYVPLRTAEVGEGFGTGQGFDIRGKEAKFAAGRKTAADSPSMFMLAQLERAIVRAEKNQVGQRFAEFTKANPDPALWEHNVEHRTWAPDSKGVARLRNDPGAESNDFDYKVNGVKQRITVKDPLLLRALKNMSASETNKFIQMAGQGTRLFSALVTSYSPEFPVTNFARDIQTALGNVTAEQGGKIAKKMVTSIPKAMRGVMRSLRDPAAKDQWATRARQFREDGGAVGFYQLKDVPALEREMKGQIKGAGPGLMARTRRALSGVTDFVEDVNKSVENGTRLAIYSAMLDSGASRQKAAQTALNSTINFSRKGEASPTVNALYAFFNANVQGAARMAQVLKTPKGKKIAAGIIAMGAAQDLYNRSVAGDANKDGTNDYDDIPEYVKGRNMVFMRGEGKTPLLFPLPYGFNVLHTAGRQMVSAGQGAVTPARAGANVASGLVNAFNPLGGEADLIQMLSPTALDPIAQHVMNRDFTGKPIKPERFPGSPIKPPSEEYFKNVSPVAREVAKGLNKVTGGDSVTPGLISVSPEIMSHYWNFLTGGMGRFLSNTAATAASVAEGEAPPLRNIPYARRFGYDAPESQAGQKFRLNADELETLWGRYKTYAKTGEREKIAKLPLPMLRAKKEFESIQYRIREIRKDVKAHPAAQERADEVVMKLQNRANAIVAAARRQAGEAPLTQ